MKKNHPVQAAFSHASHALKSLQQVAAAAASVSPRATHPITNATTNATTNAKTPLWYATLALSLTAPDWHELGLDTATQPPWMNDNNSNNNNNNNSNNNDTNPTTTMTTHNLVDRMTALLLVRVVAVAMARATASPAEESARSNQVGASSATDYSTSTICRTALLNNNKTDNHWSRWGITETVVQQIHQFVHRMVTQYATMDQVPYHNQHHAYHVTLSTNKLIDALWHAPTAATTAPTTTTTTTTTGTTGKRGGSSSSCLPKSFGLRDDPLALAAVLFSAIIHDVQHQGIPNRQLAQEDDELAILYNDQSIAENRSLFVAFREFLQPDYVAWRQVLFGTSSSEDYDGTGLGYQHHAPTYHRFRRECVNLVLNTDIASPSMTQLAKSKWQEAFGKYIAAQKAGRDALEDSFQELAQEMDEGTGQGNHVNKQVRMQLDEESSAVSRRGSRLRRDNDTDEDATPDDEGNDNGGGDSRPMPTPPPPPRVLPSQRGSFRQRLGIRRSMDLSGEALETFSSHRHRLSMKPSSDSEGTGDGNADDNTDTNDQWQDDEPDELKATVILETILTAADVAHNLQGWDQMVLWSTRLYLELRKAFVAGRGADPQGRWFENQIGFLESYLEPLATRLEDTGVYGPVVGPMFAELVRNNRDRWLVEGLAVSQNAIAKGEELYPSNK